MDDRAGVPGCRRPLHSSRPATRWRYGWWNDSRYRSVITKAAPVDGQQTHLHRLFSAYLMLAIDNFLGQPPASLPTRRPCRRSPTTRPAERAHRVEQVVAASLSLSAGHGDCRRNAPRSGCQLSGRTGRIQGQARAAQQGAAVETSRINDRARTCASVDPDQMNWHTMCRADHFPACFSRRPPPKRAAGPRRRTAAGGIAGDVSCAV